MVDLKMPAGTAFDPNRAEYCISAMFDAAGKTGCNLLELQHALKSMKAVVDAELEVRMGNAGSATAPKTSSDSKSPDRLYAGSGSV